MKKIILMILLLSALPTLAQWTKVPVVSGGQVHKIKRTSQYLFAITKDNGIFRSSNNGEFWEECNNGFTKITVYDVTEIGNTLFAACYGAGVFSSTDGGNSWTPYGPPLFTPFVQSVESVNGKLFIGTYIGIYMLEGNQWVDKTSNLPSPYIIEIRKFNNILFVNSFSDLYKSSNEGNNWIKLKSTNFADYTFKDNYIYALNTDSIYKCHIDSLKWHNMKKPYPSLYYPTSIFADSMNLYCTFQNLIYKSTNNGSSFTQVVPASSAQYPYYRPFVNGNDIFMPNIEGIMYSSDGGVNWQNRNRNIINTSFKSINFYGNEMYCTVLGKIYKTLNNGNEWILYYDGYANNGYYAANSIIKKSQDRIFIPISNSYNTILRTTNGGVNWLNGLQAHSNNTYEGEINNQDVLFLSADVLHVYHDDNTANLQWYTLPATLNSIYKFGQDFYISSEGGGIYRCSPYYVLTQVNNGLPTLASYSVTSAGGYLFAGTNVGIFRTNVSSINWTRVFQEPLGQSFMKIISYNNYLFASSGTSIYKSSDLGNSWISIYSSGPKTVNSIWNNSEYIFASIGNAGLIRRSIADAISITQSSSVVPNNFSLSQNYPNPFNPNTVIGFQIPAAGFVNLKIFDINGREISELVNEKLNAGEYKIDFNADNLPSGVYYYKMTTENFSETRKMILVK